MVRTTIEVTVLAAGWLLGGTVGLGTVMYALAIGPLAHVFIPLFAVRAPAGPLTGIPVAGAAPSGAGEPAIGGAPVYPAADAAAPA